MELNPQGVNLLIFHLGNLKNNAEEILSLKPEDKEIFEIINKIKYFLYWLYKFTDQKQIKTNKDYNYREQLIHELTSLLGKYFMQFDEDEKISKLIRMFNLINDSKEIIDLINLPFDPSEIKKIKEQNNFNNGESNRFYIDENKYTDGFPYLSQEVSNKDSNKNNNEESITDSEKNKNKFIQDFTRAIRILIIKFNNLINSNKISVYPTLKDENENDIKPLLDFFSLIFKPNSENINSGTITDSTEMTTQQLLENLSNLLDTNEINIEDDEEFEELKDEIYIKETDAINFDYIKKNLIFFINIFSKKNKKFNKKILKNISEEISRYLKINNANLFLIQNGSINNFVKSFNFEEISLKQNDNFPSISKLLELQSIKYKLLVKEYKIDKKYFDNEGNFLIPNSRQSKLRGKEIYDPPKDWIGLGLNVIGKYENDKWLEDINDKSEWAVAYRGISSKNPNFVKNLLKYFIVNQDLEIAKSNFKNNENGIYMTPDIKIAEKYTQAITFNNKIYKVLLMAKVRINKIKNYEDLNFWVLNKDDIRIYRVLFKEINYITKPNNYTLKIIY